MNAFDDDHDDQHSLGAPAPAPLAGYTGHQLRRAYLRAREVSRELMPPARNPRDMGILGIVKDGPISQRKLGDLLGVNRTIMVKLVDALEADGLLRRARSAEDRRSYALELTDTGRAAFEELSRAVAESERRLTAPLTDDERASLAALLGRMAPDELLALPDELTTRAGFLLAGLNWRLRERANEALRAVGLETRHWGALATLGHLEPCSQQELADAMGVSGPAMVHILGELEASGRVVRERNPADRRAHVLTLTPKGRADLAAARAAMDAVQQSVTDVIGEAGVTELNALLEKITS
ncbi:MarR family transcriptional regulator [Streptosporangiaceae bacterium NEAU-GS5]|nr:MarR family transcriptional regulator [Streptosporangiaceae bacterium NEAU-GS5]